MSDVQVRPRLPLPVAEGYNAPPTANQNQADPTLDTRNNVKARADKDPQQPYARRDEDNDFAGHRQENMIFVADGTPYQVITSPGVTLDIDTYGYFILRSVGSSDFSVSLPTPTVAYDAATGDPILVARAVVVDIEYSGSGKPIFSDALLPENAEPEWSSTAGTMDRVVLIWAERWSVNVANLGYSI